MTNAARETRGGCAHSFSWASSSTGATQPHEYTPSQCPLCGTWATWQEGRWKVGEDSVGSLAMADRDAWIRLFNRLQGAIQHHKNAKRGDNWDYTDEADEALYAAMARVLRDAAGFDR